MLPASYDPKCRGCRDAVLGRTAEGTAFTVACRRQQNVTIAVARGLRFGHLLHPTLNAFKFAREVTEQSNIRQGQRVEDQGTKQDDACGGSGSAGLLEAGATPSSPGCDAAANAGDPALIATAINIPLGFPLGRGSWAEMRGDVRAGDGASTSLGRAMEEEAAETGRAAGFPFRAGSRATAWLTAVDAL